MRFRSPMIHLVILGVALAVAPPAAGAEPPGHEGQSEALLTLLHTNDLHGRVHYPDAPRGLAKIATLVRQVRDEMPHVLLLDAGDTIHGLAHEWHFKGDQPIIHAMNTIPYDAMAAGNHEFDFGQDVTRAMIELARFPILSANVRDAETGEPWNRLQPYIIREIEGFRIAIFGLTTTYTVRIQWPRTLEGIEFRDEVEVARELVPHLRDEERADLIIALTHAGVRADIRLAQEVPGIDVILGGHSHTMLRQQMWVNDTLIMQTGAHAVALGRADVLLVRAEDGQTQVSINGHGGRWWGHEGVPAPAAGFEDYQFPSQPLIMLSTEIEDDPKVVEAYRPFAERLQPYLDEELTTAIEPISGENATSRETAVGQLIADAVRAYADADIGLAASGQMRGRGLEAGPVRVRDAYGLTGGYTRQHIVIVRVSGARVREMVSRAITDGRLAVQISGFRVMGDQITVGDEPLDEQKMYTVAAAAHFIQEYFLGREEVEVLLDDADAPSVRDAIIRFLRGHPPLRDAVERRIDLEPASALLLRD